MAKPYKSMIENNLGVIFKESEATKGFQYVALDNNLINFEGSEFDAQFKARLFVVVQNKDRQYRMYLKKFGEGVMTNTRDEGKGYKELYTKLKEIGIIKEN